MDRDAIERGDFPVVRRGYDQESVEAHLRRVADEFERLRGRAAPARAPLSAGTSEQVRLILEAAEQSAADIRGDAGRRAGEHVARVEEATQRMLSRIDELQSELGALLEGVRRSGERVGSELAALRERVADVQPPAPAQPEEEDFAAAAPEPAAPQPVPSEPAAPEPAPAEPARPAGEDEDEAGARIIALNMALGGSSREETAAYLADHFVLADADALLDDVYAKVGR